MQEQINQLVDQSTPAHVLTMLVVALRLHAEERRVLACCPCTDARAAIVYRDAADEIDELLDVYADDLTGDVEPIFIHHVREDCAARMLTGQWPDPERTQPLSLQSREALNTLRTADPEEASTRVGLLLAVCGEMGDVWQDHAAIIRDEDPAAARALVSIAEVFNALPGIFGRFSLPAPTAIEDAARAERWSRRRPELQVHAVVADLAAR